MHVEIIGCREFEYVHRCAGGREEDHPDFIMPVHGPLHILYLPVTIQILRHQSSEALDAVLFGIMSSTNRRQIRRSCLSIVTRGQVSLFVHVFWRFDTTVTRLFVSPRLPFFPCADAAGIA